MRCWGISLEKSDDDDGKPIKGHAIAVDRRGSSYVVNNNNCSRVVTSGGDAKGQR